MHPTAQHAPATTRNREPILGVLRDVLPASGLILEIASGTGEHVRYFAENLPGLDWQPSDPDPDALASIVAWSEGIPNIRPPLRLDASAPDWPLARADAILCINMVHISPWTATEGLFSGAARILPPGAPLYLYGPYRRDDVPTAPSNEAFNESLKARNPEWGLRHLDDVLALGDRTGLRFERLVEMPANNLSVLFRCGA
jgi:SAM-dependent methyltransferase